MAQGFGLVASNLREEGERVNGSGADRKEIKEKRARIQLKRGRGRQERNRSTFILHSLLAFSLSVRSREHVKCLLALPRSAHSESSARSIWPLPWRRAICSPAQYSCVHSEPFLLSVSAISTLSLATSLL